MSGFDCGICKQNKDEVDHVTYNGFLNGHPVCDECHFTYVVIDKEIDEEKQMDYYPDVFSDVTGHTEEEAEEKAERHFSVTGGNGGR